MSIVETIVSFLPFKKEDRRKRLSKPRALLVFGAVFMVLPVLNYFLVAYRLEIHYSLVAIVFSRMPAHTLVMLGLPFVVGIGLLQVKKWGWWAFLCYAVLLLSHNTVSFIIDPGYYNFGSIFNSLIFFIAIVYFTRKDISAPYFKMYPRGWRLQQRKPVVMKIKVNEMQLETNDFTQSGFYVEWADHDLSPGDEVQVRVTPAEGEERVLTGGVVRVDAAGAGIAFRRLDRESNEYLESIAGTDPLLMFVKKIARKLGG